jgi:hypothetical protein
MRYLFDTIVKGMCQDFVYLVNTLANSKTNDLEYELGSYRELIDGHIGGQQFCHTFLLRPFAQMMTKGSSFFCFSEYNRAD